MEWMEKNRFQKRTRIGFLFKYGDDRGGGGGGGEGIPMKNEKFIYNSAILQMVNHLYHQMIDQSFEIEIPN